MKQTVIDKYNVPVPRYTSYPPANYFVDLSEADYRQAVRQSNLAHEPHLSFYLHMPFCRQLCHYCACNSYVMPDAAAARRYVEALHREIDLLLPLLHDDRRIAQIHYGGGTPTAMDTQVIARLNGHLLGSFHTIDRPEIAIECHPGYLTLTDWQQLCDAGFTRMSIGVQDFSTQVLHTVGRRPALVPLEQVGTLLHEGGIRFNLDFIYGLPHQTPDSFASTIERAISIGPDRMVLFSYAHVPWLKPRQRVLEKAGLPDPEMKEQLFERARKMLVEAGYLPVGMDHFVRPDDELAQAVATHQLHRNFQGYCTRRTTAQVYALGVTGISQLETAYAQNTKDVDLYINKVENGQLPVARGYRLSEEEQLTRDIVEQLMCNYRVTLPQALLHTPALSDMQADGIISIEGSTIVVTTEGTPFVRNVAAALDPLMRHTDKAFSKPI